MSTKNVSIYGLPILTSRLCHPDRIYAVGKSPVLGNPTTTIYRLLRDYRERCARERKHRRCSASCEFKVEKMTFREFVKDALERKPWHREDYEVTVMETRLELEAAICEEDRRRR